MEIIIIGISVIVISMYFIKKAITKRLHRIRHEIRDIEARLEATNQYLENICYLLGKGKRKNND